MKKNEIEIFRSLVLLGINLRDLVEMNGDSSLFDRNGKLLSYIRENVIFWVTQQSPNQKKILSENELDELVYKVIDYITSNGLMARDIEVNENHIEKEYYSDLHLINTNENKYGDKHFGTSFRDNGPFGSLPLYDDYSEESDS